MDWIEIFGNSIQLLDNVEGCEYDAWACVDVSIELDINSFVMCASNKMDCKVYHLKSLCHRNHTSFIQFRIYSKIPIIFTILFADFSWPNTIFGGGVSLCMHLIYFFVFWIVSKMLGMWYQMCLFTFDSTVELAFGINSKTHTHTNYGHSHTQRIFCCLIKEHLMLK